MQKKQANKKKAKKKAGKTPSKFRTLALKGVSGLHLELPAKITPTQLDLWTDLNYEDWDQTLYKIAQVGDGARWWLGDAMKYGDKHFGEIYMQAVGETGLAEDTMRRYLLVASRISPVNRVKELTWSHHRQVASCPEGEQIRWLRMALDHNWSLAELKEAMRKKGQRSANKEDGEQQDLTTGCVSCHASVAPMKICASCATLPVTAVATVGIEAATALLSKKTSDGESG